MAADRIESEVPPCVERAEARPTTLDVSEPGDGTAPFVVATPALRPAMFLRRESAPPTPNQWYRLGERFEYSTNEHSNLSPSKTILVQFVKVY